MRTKRSLQIEETMVGRLGSKEAYKVWRSEIGKMGGKKSKGGSFKDKDFARRMGKIGGEISRPRGKDA